MMDWSDDGDGGADLVPGYAHPYSRGPYLTTNATKDTDNSVISLYDYFLTTRTNAVSTSRICAPHRWISIPFRATCLSLK